MTKISIIVAMSDNRAIGKDNKLPWFIPEDLEWFRENTVGKPVIMGRKTHESIGKKLPGRLNIVVSKDKSYIPLNNQVKAVTSLKEAISLCVEYEEIFIIGGEQIYREAINIADKMYITRIEITINGDAYFPEYDNKLWQASSRRMSGDRNYIYEFLVLERVK